MAAGSCSVDHVLTGQSFHQAGEKHRDFVIKNTHTHTFYKDMHILNMLNTHENYHTSSSLPKPSSGTGVVPISTSYAILSSSRKLKVFKWALSTWSWLTSSPLLTMARTRLTHSARDTDGCDIARAKLLGRS